MTTKDKIRIGMSDIGTSVEKMVENITNNIYFKAGEESQKQKIIEKIEKLIIKWKKINGINIRDIMKELLNSLGEKEQ
jgi:hypothetical protein